MLKMVYAFEHASGPKTPFDIGSSDFAQFLVDPTLANALLGWKAK